jgi:hypothetical protein
MGYNVLNKIILVLVRFLGQMMMKISNNLLYSFHNFMLIVISMYYNQKKKSHQIIITLSRIHKHYRNQLLTSCFSNNKKFIQFQYYHNASKSEAIGVVCPMFR